MALFSCASMHQLLEEALAEVDSLWNATTVFACHGGDTGRVLTLLVKANSHKIPFNRSFYLSLISRHLYFSLICCSLGHILLLFMLKFVQEMRKFR